MSTDLTLSPALAQTQKLELQWSFTPSYVHCRHPLSLLRLFTASSPFSWEAVTGQEQPSLWSQKSCVLAVHHGTANFTSLSFRLKLLWWFHEVRHEHLFLRSPAHDIWAELSVASVSLPISTFSYKPALDGNSWCRWRSATICLSLRHWQKQVPFPCDCYTWHLHIS